MAWLGVWAPSPIRTGVGRSSAKDLIGLRMDYITREIVALSPPRVELARSSFQS
jgi:hypothetical protein